MADYTFSPGISDDVRQNTIALFDWLRNRTKIGENLPPYLQNPLEAGIMDVHAKVQFGGYSAMHIAVQHGEPAIMEWMHRHGAEPDAPCNNGDTALYIAVKQIGSGSLGALFNSDVEGPKNPTTIHWLLKNGANVNVQSDAGDCPVAFYPHCAYHAQQAQPTFDEWHDKTLPATELTKEHVMQLLSVWPLADPKTPAPRFEHLDAIFKDERWNEVDPQQKLDLIKEIPGISRREQMYLLGGNAARVMIKNEAQPQQGVER